MKINRNVENFDREQDWPSNAFCKEKAPQFPQNVEGIYPVFLPFENKGVRYIKDILIFYCVYKDWYACTVSESNGVPVSRQNRLHCAIPEN